MFVLVLVGLFTVAGVGLYDQGVVDVTSDAPYVSVDFSQFNSGTHKLGDPVVAPVYDNDWQYLDDRDDN